MPQDTPPRDARRRIHLLGPFSHRQSFIWQGLRSAVHPQGTWAGSWGIPWYPMPQGSEGDMCGWAQVGGCVWVHEVDLNLIHGRGWDWRAWRGVRASGSEKLIKYVWFTNSDNSLMITLSSWGPTYHAKKILLQSVKHSHSSLQIKVNFPLWKSGTSNSNQKKLSG